MFTKYPEIFTEVQRKIKNNLAYGNVKKGFFTSHKDIEQLIDQVVFEVLDSLDVIEKELINNM